MRLLSIKRLAVLGFILWFGLACSEMDDQTRICSHLGLGHKVNILSNLAYAGDLLLDLYQPERYTGDLRPLLIMVHGMGDHKGVDEIAFHCYELARRGIAVATINWTPPQQFKVDSSLYFQTGVNPIVDLNKAIDFFVQDARGANYYHIDTSRLFVGGASFGAIAALHVGMVDDIQQFQTPFQQSLISLGTNPDKWKLRQQKIKGVVNFSGWIWDLSFVDEEDPPVFSVYGDRDKLIPFESDTAFINGIPIMLVAGPGDLHQKLEQYQGPDELMVIEGFGHVAYYDPEWKDLVSEKLFQFLTRIMCETH